MRLLAYEGDRIFTTDRARELAPLVVSRTPTSERHSITFGETDWIVPLRRGLYALSSTVPTYRTPTSLK